MAGVAHRDGLHSPEEHGGAENLRHGLFAVPDAVTSCHQARVWRLESVGGYAGYRALEGKTFC